MMKIVIFVIVKVKLGCGLAVPELWNLTEDARKVFDEVFDISEIFEDKNILEEIENLKEAAKEVFGEDFGISEILEDTFILQGAKGYEDRRKRAEESEKAAMDAVLEPMLKE